MADPHKIASILEQHEVPTDVVEEVIKDLTVASKAAQTTAADTDDALRLQILNEPDWRKRAALSALLISRSLS